MNAITVRNNARKLVCFGPDDGNYEPSVLGKPVGAVTRRDENYGDVLAEWTVDRALDPPPPTEADTFANNLAVALTNPTIKQLLKEAVR